VLRLPFALFACTALVSAVDLENHLHKSAPTGLANRLFLSADIGSIAVEPGNGATVDVDVEFVGSPPSRKEFEKMRSDFTLDIKQSGNDLRITGAFHKGWQPMLATLPAVFGGLRMCHDFRCLEYGDWLREVRYRVTMPAKMNADLETTGGAIAISKLESEVNARTSGGPINVDDSKGKIVVHTSGGPIRITGAGEVEASTSGGPILIERNAGRVRAHTSGGGIEIRDSAAAVEASTAGGSVRASFVAQPAEGCRLTTSGGGINVTVARNIHLDLDASTSGGGVWTNFAPQERDSRRHNELHTQINGGGPLLYLHTSGGGIQVRRED
jgi:hypothetical protein